MFGFFGFIIGVVGVGAAVLVLVFVLYGNIPQVGYDAGGEP